MSTIETAGYVVINDVGVWGTGATEQAAWADFETEMKMAQIVIVPADSDTSEMSGSWTCENDYSVRPASAALLAEVATRGGNIGWCVRDGICCTRDEADA